MRVEKTTRKPTMIKSVNNAVNSESDLLALGAKYFNELANGYFFECEEVHFDNDKKCWMESDNSYFYETIDDFCSEVSYFLSCYYECGHCRHEDEYNDRKAFIKYLEVFKPFCKEKHTKYIPYKEETKFLFD